MRAAWLCGSVAPIPADAALQGCAALYRSARTAARRGAGKGIAYLARNRKFESISLQRGVKNEPGSLAAAAPRQSIP
jgi:hypothetical protein